MTEKKKCSVYNAIISNYTKLEDLPEDLIHDIMHMLPYREAAKFKVLSKSLNRYWLSFPTVHFEYDSYNLPNDVSYDDFYNFVRKNLELRDGLINGCLQNLSLSYNSMGGPYPPRYPEVFDALLNFAFQNNVREINFDIKEPVEITVNVTYDLLRPLFSSQFLTVLKLGGIKIPLVDDDVSIECPKLTELQFQNCQGFRTIKVSCSSLKQVEVIKCRGMRAFHIEEGKSLHCFKIEGQLCPLKIQLPADFVLHDLRLIDVPFSEIMIRYGDQVID